MRLDQLNTLKGGERIVYVDRPVRKPGASSLVWTAILAVVAVAFATTVFTMSPQERACTNAGIRAAHAAYFNAPVTAEGAYFAGRLVYVVCMGQ